MRKGLLAAVLIGSALGIPNAASAAEAYVVGGVNVRAGPDRQYPAIVALPAGTPVTVYGCLQGWRWCDVSWGNYRGWAYGKRLAYEYRQRRVVIPSYGPQVGLPIISFSIGTYWDEHYRDRSFYRDRDRWEHQRAPGPRQVRRVEPPRADRDFRGQPDRRENHGAPNGRGPARYDDRGPGRGHENRH